MPEARSDAYSTAFILRKPSELTAVIFKAASKIKTNIFSSHSVS